MEFKGELLRFGIDSIVNQFLFNYVDDENFDDAKEELKELMKLSAKYPECIDDIELADLDDDLDG